MSLYRLLVIGMFLIIFLSLAPEEVNATHCPNTSPCYLDVDDATFVTSVNPDVPRGNLRFVALSSYEDTANVVCVQSNNAPCPVFTESWILLSFNLSSLTDDELLDVQLQLSQYGRNVGNEQTISFHRILGSWNESVTWNSAPPVSDSYGTVENTSTYFGLPPTPLLFDVPPSLIEDMMAASLNGQNYGMALRSEFPLSPGVVFCSDDYNGSPGPGVCQVQDIPQLVIDFIPNAPPSVPNNIAPENGALTGLNITIDWSDSIDPDGDSVTYNVYLRDDQNQSFTLIATNLSDSTFQAELEPNRNYEWYVVAKDVHGAQSQSPTWSFSTASAFCSDVLDISFQECMALEEVYDELGGDNWTNTLSNNNVWFEDQTPCTSNWHGVICDANNEHITKLLLYDNNIEGNIPDAIGDFEFLEELNLGNTIPNLPNNNNLNGSQLPLTVARLSNLRKINLRYTGIGGEFPLAQIGSLQNLEEIIFDWNQFTGTLPKQIANMVNLRVLRLQGNQFYGEIPPELGNLPELKQLDLSHNHFTGGVPLSIEQLGDTLQYLTLQSNNLDTPINEAICALSNLRTLRLDKNRFFGNIPDCIVQLINTEVVLGYNRLFETTPLVRQWLTAHVSAWDQQTITPLNFGVRTVGESTITVGWNLVPIAQSLEQGCYEIFHSAEPFADLSLLNPVCIPLNLNSYTFTNLDANLPHYFWIRTFTPEHGTGLDHQPNRLYSEFSTRASKQAPSVPSNISVSGDLDGLPITPIVSWDHDPNMQQIEIYIGDPSGQQFLYRPFDLNSDLILCDFERCSLRVEAEFTQNGDYSLYLRARNLFSDWSDWSGRLGNTYSPIIFSVTVPVPSQIAPIGTVDVPLSNPIYTWTDVSGAEYYYIYVANSIGQQVINEVVADIGYCNGSICQIDFTTFRETYRLSNGTYTWYLRGWQDNQVTPWSTGATFTIQSDLPNTVTKISPLSNAVETDYAVTFQWELENTAVGYNLYLVNPNGVSIGIIRGEVGDEVTCIADICEWTLEIAEVNGRWTWYIQAFNAAGAGNWSSATTFTVPSAIPNIITKVAPSQNGTLESTVTTFSWIPDISVTQYQLYITGPNSWASDVTYTVGQNVTCSTNCSVNVTLPVNGSYSWYLRGYSLAGWGQWSAGEATDNYGVQTFTVTDTLPDAITKLTPTQGQHLNDLAVTFSWNADPYATYYQTYVVDPNGYVSDRTLMVGTDVTCTSTCDTVVTLPSNGTYRWYLRGYSGAGWGPWSEGEASDSYGVVNFTVGQQVPEVITKIAPIVNADLSNLDTTFSWQLDVVATKYEFYITGPNGYTFDHEYNVGSDTTCNSVCLLELTLPANGTYTWYVRGGNAAGWGLWDAGQPTTYGGVAFTVNMPLPDVIGKTGPVANQIVPNIDMSFDWISDSNATKYEIYITEPNGYTFNQVYNVGTSLTCTSMCTLPHTLPANGTYTWYVRGGNAAGWGLWDAGQPTTYGGVAFTVNMPLPDVIGKTGPVANQIVPNIDMSFDWISDSNATKYEIYITGPNGYTFNQIYNVGTSLTCTSMCTLPHTLPANGTYMWYIRGGNVAGWGLWSLGEVTDGYGGLAFAVNMPVPSAATLLTPVDDGIIYQTNRPTFRWNEISTVTYYRLYIVNGMNMPIYDQWHQATTICADGTCILRLPNPIAYGGYTWKIQTYNIAGIGAFSEIRSFLSLSFNLQPLMVEGESAQITRSGAWVQQSSDSAMGQFYLQSSTSGTDTLTMTFTGTQVDVVYVTGAEYGTFVVEIDGEPLHNVNANATQTAFGQIASFTDLADGEHTLRIIPLGGTPVAIDALVVDGQVMTNQPDPIDMETPVVIPVQPTEQTPRITPEPEVTNELIVVTIESTATSHPTPVPTHQPTMPPEVTNEP